MIHIATLTPSGSRALCGCPLGNDDNLVGDDLGDDLATATCTGCLGAYLKSLALVNQHDEDYVVDEEYQRIKEVRDGLC